MISSAELLLLPRPQAGWLAVGAQRKDAEVSEPASLVEAEGVWVGLPARYCRSLGLVLPNADHSLMEGMVRTALERLGLRPDHEHGPRFNWQVISQSASQAVVSVDVLAESLPVEMLQPKAAGYLPALRLRQLPANQLLIALEQGMLVVAVGVHGRLYHSHVLGSAEGWSPADLGRELRWIAMALEAELPQHPVHGVTWAAEVNSADFIEQLSAAAALPCQVVRELELQSAGPEARAALLPAEVCEARTRRGSRLRLRRLALVLGGGLSLLVVALGLSLKSLQREAAELEARAQQDEAGAAQVRQTAQRWKQLLPAVESRYYPMQMLAQITALMPPSGVVIRRFQVRQGQVEIQGDARDAQSAVQFMEDLQKHPQLGQLQWSKASPSVRDGVAQFRTQGKPQ